MVEQQNIRPAIALLREVKLLRPFTDAELTAIAQLGQGVAYEAHSNIVIEGEIAPDGGGLFLILNGSVGIFKTNKFTGESYDVGQLRRGSFFGEMSLIDNNPRSATVKALTDCQLFLINKEAFHRFLNQSAEIKLKFYDSCIKTLIGRLRELDDNYVISQYQLWKVALKKEAA